VGVASGSKLSRICDWGEQDLEVNQLSLAQKEFNLPLVEFLENWGMSPSI
jgi:hypothetical protein